MAWLHYSIGLCPFSCNKKVHYSPLEGPYYQSSYNNCGKLTKFPQRYFIFLSLSLDLTHLKFQSQLITIYVFHVTYIFTKTKLGVENGEGCKPIILLKLLTIIYFWKYFQHLRCSAATNFLEISSCKVFEVQAI